MKLFFDPLWNYKETVVHLEALKSQYEEILASFSYFQLHEKVNFIRSTRNALYSLHLLEWQKDRIWNCMNGNDDLYNIYRSAFKRK